MPKIDRFAFIGGPYLPPKTRPGRRLFCEIRGTVIVGGFLDGPIPWPFVKKMGTRSPILCGSLVRAVKTEAAIAVAHHFGLAKSTVGGFRRVLGVGRSTEGTKKLTSQIAKARDDDRLDRARANSKLPPALAKQSAVRKGKPPHPNSRAGALKAAMKPRTERWRAKMADYWRSRGHPPGHPESRFWTPEEDALLGTMTDVKLAAQINRTWSAVACRREKLGVPSFRSRKQRV